MATRLLAPLMQTTRTDTVFLSAVMASMNLGVAWSLISYVGATSMSPGWIVMDQVVSRHIWPVFFFLAAILDLGGIKNPNLLRVGLWMGGGLMVMWATATLFAWPIFGPQPGAFLLYGVGYLKHYVATGLTRVESVRKAIEQASHVPD